MPITAPTTQVVNLQSGLVIPAGRSLTAPTTNTGLGRGPHAYKTTAHDHY